tara:strand:+ start:15 stop:434 length:420 start_codon:yes stop_codon:yes gene_type:complete
MTFNAEKLGRGRPSSYLPEYADIAYEYSENTWKDCGDLIPTIERLAKVLGHTVKGLRDWGNKYEDFGASLDAIKETQKIVLFNGSLGGEYNATIAKLILSANHGMSEKTEQHMTSDGSLAPTTITLRGIRSLPIIEQDD